MGAVKKGAYFKSARKAKAATYVSARGFSVCDMRPTKINVLLTPPITACYYESKYDVFTVIFSHQTF